MPDYEVFKKLISLLVDVGYGIIWGLILLIVSATILPEPIFLKVIQKIKPDLISKTKILSRIRLVFDYVFNQKEVVIRRGSWGQTLKMEY